MSDSYILLALHRIGIIAISSTVLVLTYTGMTLWDLVLAGGNLVSLVVPRTQHKAGNLWPSYVEPTATDSRSPCPALNALANHGIIPHSGRGLSFRNVAHIVQTSYNLSSTFSFLLCAFAANMLGRSYWTGRFDLNDLNVHNGIEHDASLTREDAFRVADQSKPSVARVHELLASGTGPRGDLTPADFARLSSAARRSSRDTNGQYTLDAVHKIFASGNCGLMLTVFGGRVKDLRPILLEERIPDGWQTHVQAPFGLTLLEFQPTVMRVELGIKEEVESSSGGDSKRSE